MSDIHALSGAYAVDALEQFERVQFERHMAECGVCAAEVDSLREAAGLMAEAVAVAPPAHLRDRVLADIGAVRPLPPLATPSSRRPARRLRALVAAAAAVVAVGGGGLAATQLGSDAPSSPAVQLSAADRVLQAPDAERWSKRAKGGGTVTVVRSKALNKAVVTTEDLAAAPSGHTLELWLQHDNIMLPAGYLEDGGDQQVVLDGDAASAQGFGITIEPATGSREPSEKIVALLDFQSV